MEFVTDNWQLITFVAVPALLVAVLNWKTKHYTDADSKWGMWLLLAIDVLDVLRPILSPSSPPRGLKVFKDGRWVTK